MALESLENAEAIPFAIANALQLKLTDREDALKQVADNLGSANAFFVLDNFEHLLPGAPMMVGLLQQCPRLKLLITSRERLNVAGEWLYPVDGLAYPSSDSVSPEESQTYDAVKLFVQRVQQVRPSFALVQKDVPFVLRLCRHLGGSPLGLELAAISSRFLTLEDISREIETNLDLLAHSRPAASRRHHSARAVLDYSWRLLTPTEQGVLAQLTAFHGGFRREAAQEVAEAPLAVLAALVDKSLLRLEPTGRYTFHPLVHQYTAEKLSQAERSRVTEKHARYYLELVQLTFETLSASGRADRVQEFENIHAAWKWAVANKKADLVKRCTFGMSIRFQGRRGEGIKAFASAVEQFSAEVPEPRALLGHLLVALAEQRITYRFIPAEVSGLLTKALTFLDKDEPRAIIRASRLLATCERDKGNFAHYRSILEDTLALAQQRGVREEIPMLMCYVGMALHESGAPEEAFHGYMVSALKQLEALGTPFFLAFLLLIYGRYFVDHNRLAEGEALLKRSSAIVSRSGGRPELYPYILLGLAHASYRRGAYDEVESLLREVLEGFKTVNPNTPQR